ncbi:MAG: pesticidal protein Cry7Aa [Candidatus Liptonbacteria bacterium]|nr:pesticidal protein Cry7Aa [Candidatus Liptonbacteria bacterium]
MHKIKVEKLGIILKPTKNSFEEKAVLNPGIYQDGEFVHVFYRAKSKKEISTIGYAKLNGPTKIVERLERPLMIPQYKYEKKGLEDPRITKIGKTFYMTYVAHDGKHAVTAYAESQDLKKFKKRGVISPEIKYDQAAKYFREGKLKDRYFMFESYYEEQAGADVYIWEKDVFLFPKKFGGNFAMIHRILPDIQLIYFKNFDEIKSETFWGEYLRHLSKYVVLENKYWFESRNIGGGAVPLETKYGWLLIFHTVEEVNKNKIYHASAALLDKKNPLKLLGRLDEPLFSPTEKWERGGFPFDVVFPTGTAVFGEDLYIYYGAADKYIAVAKVNLDELLFALISSKNK